MDIYNGLTEHISRIFVFLTRSNYDCFHLTLFTRCPKTRRYTEAEYLEMENEVHFQSIDVKIALSKIYRRVSFETAG